MDTSKKIIRYNTRDGKGNNIVADVKIKQFSASFMEFDCPICGRHAESAISVKDIVSSSFTDWTYMGDYVCPDCANLFSLYFYSYIVDPDGIRILNVRELRDELIKPQKPPFLFCITTSRKKHLFYRAVWNHEAGRFAVNLETETIFTTPKRMRELFDFVEALQTLGASKERLKAGEIPFKVAQLVPASAWVKLRRELVESREIQIPLYCGQKREISEEEAVCTITSTLTI